MQRKQRLQREAYLRNLAENHSDPSVRFQAEQQLMGVDEIDLPKPEASEWETVGSPSKGGVYRVNPATGETELLVEPPVGGAGEPQYGTGANWVRMGQREDGSTKWGTLRLNDAGEQEVVPLPEGTEPWTGVQNDPELIREREVARGYGGMEPEAIQQMNSNLAAAKTQLAQTNHLLSELEEGKYNNDIGPFFGRIKQFFNPDTALMQMYSVDAALQNLQITNLAPVTEFELQLIMQMDANAFRTVDQNKAVLRRLKEIREAKVKMLDEGMKRIRREGYESFLRNPPALDEKLFAPIEGVSSGAPSGSSETEAPYGGKDPNEVIWLD
jgi:hypothetical protein